MIANRFRNLVWPVVLALVITGFLFRQTWKPGLFPTHDGQFHFVRLLHFVEALQSGAVLPVRLVPDLAYGYGYPVFQFFYVVPFYVMALGVFLGLNPVASWKLSWFGLTMAMLVVFYDLVQRWLRSVSDTSAKRDDILVSASVATIIFGLVPIRFSMMLVSGQLGGYWGWFFSLVVLWAFHLFWVEGREIAGGLVFSVALAGLIGSHLLSIILFSFVFIGYGAWQILKDFSWLRLVRLGAWFGLGVGLATFFWLPFLLEKELVQLGNQVLIDHSQHWPTFRQLIYSAWGHGFSTTGTADGMSFQIGLAVLLGVGAASLTWIWTDRSKESEAGLWLSLFGLTFLLMLSISQPIWQMVSLLQLVQYPWRLLVVSTTVGSVIVAWLIWRLTGWQRWIVASCLVLLALVNVRNYAQPWPVDWFTAEEVKVDPGLFAGSTDISWELRPATVVEQPTLPLATLVSVPNGQVLADQTVNQGGHYRQFLVEAPTETQVTLPIWAWPHWLMVVNDQVVESRSDQAGRVVVTVPAGKTQIKIQVQKTLTQKWADVLSLISFGIWTIMAGRLLNSRL